MTWSYRQKPLKILPDIQPGFRKGIGTRDQIVNLCVSQKKRIPEKISTPALLTTPKLLTVWITTNCGKSFKRWEGKTTLPASYKTCMQVKKQQLKTGMEQQTHYKLGKEYQDFIVSCCLFNLYAECIMQNARLDESQAGIKIAEVSVTLDMQMTPLLWQKARKN